MSWVKDAEIKYPEFMKSARELAFYDMKIANWIKTNYGDNTLNEILKTNEYNIKLEQVRNGINDGSPLARFAAKRNELFKIYSAESFRLSDKLNYKTILELMDNASVYYKGLALAKGFKDR